MFTIIAGTRPEIIKLAPVYFALKNQNINVCWIHSGQHNCDTYDFFGIRPDEKINLKRKSNSLSELTSLLIEKLNKLYLFKLSNKVIVHGDTTTAFCASLVSYYNKKKVFHIESGLRTHKDEPFPEEKNREMIARLSNLNFSPTNEAKQNLINEGIDENKIFVTGNTIVDATLYAKSKINDYSESESKNILVTAHRRENWNKGIANICKALNLIASSYNNINIIFPVHPNPAIKNIVKNEVKIDKIKICEPFNYGKMIETICNSWLVLTDSGGIQEECITLQKPVLVLREETERKEIIELGAGRLVGTDTNKICEYFNKIYHNESFYQSMQIPIEKNPYGDGKASEKIASRLLQETTSL
jgi:UDP-N-acetylglucosamine 2-epimerase